MVLCEGATIFNFVASAMMNGVCCMHTMEDEERRKRETEEAMRKVISAEWQRQSFLEQKRQERFMEENGLDPASVMADERRRLYIATKMMASSQHSSRASHSITSRPSDDDYQYAEFVAQRPINRRDDDDQDQRSVPESPAPRFRFGDARNDCRREPVGLNTRSRSAPVENGRNNSEHIPLTVGRVSSITPSLFDDESDDEDFDEVKLV